MCKEKAIPGGTVCLCCKGRFYGINDVVEWTARPCEEFTYLCKNCWLFATELKEKPMKNTDILRPLNIKE